MIELQDEWFFNRFQINQFGEPQKNEKSQHNISKVIALKFKVVKHFWRTVEICLNLNEFDHY